MGLCGPAFASKSINGRFESSSWKAQSRRDNSRRFGTASSSELSAARLLVLRKDVETVDQKLIAKYEIDLTERQRAYRKKRGFANMQYIRHGRWFLLMATDGHHSFKQDEKNQIRDCRRNPIKFEGYSISYRRSGLTPKGGGDPKWHACVRIDNATYRELKAFFLARATHRSVENLSADFARVPFARYAPIRRQLLTIHRTVNKARQSAGYEPIPASSLVLRRTIVSPFS